MLDTVFLLLLTFTAHLAPAEARRFDVDVIGRGGFESTFSVERRADGFSFTAVDKGRRVQGPIAHRDGLSRYLLDIEGQKVPVDLTALLATLKPFSTDPSQSARSKELTIQIVTRDHVQYVHGVGRDETFIRR